MKLRNILAVEFKLLFSRPEFYFAISVIMLLCIASFVSECIRLYGSDLSSVYPANEMWIGWNALGTAIWKVLLYFFVLPIAASMAYGDSHFVNRRCGVIKYILTRCERKKYIVVKGIVVFVSGFLVIAVPLFLNQLLCLVAFPVRSCIHTENWPSYYPMDFVKGMFFPQVYMKHPYLYNLIFMAIAGIWGSVFALFSYVLSLFNVNKRVVVVVLPFIVFALENFIWGLLGKARYCLMYYMDANGGVENMSVSFFAAVTAACLVFCAAVIAVQALKLEDVLV